MMKIKCCAVGALATNCYLIETDRKWGIAVDPGAEAARLLATIREMDLDLQYILLTTAISIILVPFHSFAEVLERRS